jgi:hypothetical protein
MTEYQFQYEYYNSTLQTWIRRFDPIESTIDEANSDKEYLLAHFGQTYRNIRIVEVKEI